MKENPHNSESARDFNLLESDLPESATVRNTVEYIRGILRSLRTARGQKVAPNGQTPFLGRGHCESRAMRTRPKRPTGVEPLDAT